MIRSTAGRAISTTARSNRAYAALLLAARGLAVTVVERADAPGGKMRMTDVTV